MLNFFLFIVWIEKKIENLFDYFFYFVIFVGVLVLIIVILVLGILFGIRVKRWMKRGKFVMKLGSYLGFSFDFKMIVLEFVEDILGMCCNLIELNWYGENIILLYE